MYHLGETGFLIKITIMNNFLMGIHVTICIDICMTFQNIIDFAEAVFCLKCKMGYASRCNNKCT